tara:strand:+ start:131 stop:391 length:261 start_codon:yes stop_codon:yes gene_type:complete
MDWNDSNFRKKYEERRPEHKFRIDVQWDCDPPLPPLFFVTREQAEDCLAFYKDQAKSIREWIKYQLTLTVGDYDMPSPNAKLIELS